MGQYHHRTIAVTSFDVQILSFWHAKALEIFSDVSQLVTPIFSSRINGCHSFYVIPSGLKIKPMDESNDFSIIQNQFVEFCNLLTLEDDVDFVDIVYGGDMQKQAFVLNESPRY